MSFLINGLCRIRSLAVQSVPTALLLPLLASILDLPLFAQTTGMILGQISDPSGAAVTRASVTAENLGTGLRRTAQTNTEGIYLIPALPTGTYKVTIETAGFKTFSQTGITLQVGQNARVDVPLELGAVSESVNVSASALSVDTQSTTIGATVDNRRIVSIPLNGRNVLALAQLLPGVGTANLPTAYTFSRSGPTISISGSRTNENNIMLDGTTLIGAMGNVGQNLPSPDTLQEFRVLTNTYAAEYGRAAGGVFLAITKSGTNEVHGSLWEFLRNDALNARNFFSAGKPLLRQNQFGVSAGGPVIKNRTFIFGSYQGLRISQQSIITTFPPSAKELAGDFSGATQPVIDPLNGQPFPGNIIPQPRFDPLANNISKLYVPAVNQPNGSSVFLRSIPTSGNQFSIKADHKLRDADNLSVRFYRNKDSQDNQRGGDSTALAGPAENTVTSWTAAETHVFNPGLLNEFRASYTRVFSLFTTSPLNKTPRELGANFNQDGPFPLVPNVTVSGRFAITPQFPLPEPDDLFQYDEKLSWIHGRHSAKFGAQLIRIRHLSRGQFNSSGGFTFDGSFTRNAVADYLIGRPSNLFMQSPLEDATRNGNYHLYAQDDFKVNRRLTLNLGLRYELNTPYVQLHDWTSSIRPYVGCAADCAHSTKFPTAPAGLVFPGDPGVPRGLINTDKNNFAPRLGFAWDPFGGGRTSVRGAYAIFYDYTGAIISATVNQTLPYVLPISLDPPPSFSDPWQGRQDPYPHRLNPANPAFIYPVQAYSVSKDFRDGYIQQFNLNVQHQFGSDWVIQMGYYGRLGRKLSANHEGNPAIYGPGATSANIQSRRPFLPQYYASIGLITSDTNASYNGLQLSMEKKFSHGYTLQAAYTYSKSIDERSGFSVDGASGANPFNYRKGDRGPSTFDQRHILALNGVWEIPFLGRKGLLTTAFGGWQLAGTVRVASGFPFNPISGADVALAGTGRGSTNQVPNVVGDPRLDTGRARKDLVAAYFNTAAYARPSTGQFGNSGRDNVIGPGFSQTDLAVLKRFQIPKERLGRFEFRSEIFNLLNQVNFNNPNNNLLSPAFGRLLSSRDARIVQFALRHDF
jgi:hypothetical protein